MPSRPPAPPSGPPTAPGRDADGEPSAAREAEGEAERRFLADYDVRAFDRPSVAVDVVLTTLGKDQAGESRLQALLLPREEHPFRGRFALPGGFVRLDEGLDAAARRVLREKAGVEGVYLEQLFTFGAPDRDPRTRVISVAYVALVAADRLAGPRPAGLLAGLAVPWEGETGGPVEALDAEGRALPLAFDHADVLGMAVKRLRGKLGYTPIGFQLLPECFTLRALQSVHETILGRPLNKDSFRRRMLSSGELEATGDHEDEVGHRPAELYRFARRSAL